MDLHLPKYQSSLRLFMLAQWQKPIFATWQSDCISGHAHPQCPAALYAGILSEDQRIYRIPSKKIVIIRMGKASEPENFNLAEYGFDETLWQKINAVID